MPANPATASPKRATRPLGEARSDAILDAGERVFAANGFKGATMREIAQAAGVAQGLIHYHYVNKAMLFEAVVARRSTQINERRAALVDQLFAPGRSPRLCDVVEALFRPTIETGIELASDGGAFARILVSMANSADPTDQALAEKYYDPIARKFIDALMRVEPRLGQEDAVWAYMFAIGVGMTMMAKTGRPARLSGGVCDDGDVERMLKKIVPFICGGIEALTRNREN